MVKSHGLHFMKRRVFEDRRRIGVLNLRPGWRNGPSFLSLQPEHLRKLVPLGFSRRDTARRGGPGGRVLCTCQVCMCVYSGTRVFCMIHISGSQPPYYCNKAKSLELTTIGVFQSSKLFKFRFSRIDFFP